MKNKYIKKHCHVACLIYEGDDERDESTMYNQSSSNIQFFMMRNKNHFDWLKL